ncbi:uncharacterized protein with von Willebrand factor type A (vWA) domain [Bradyrhizobium sp. S3.12.5]|uniref:hypothetical protein n=1 Tax=Bradyrhizobium sp. S3.12.5 TaxID=3156386 RepID=UPI0033924CFE
MHLTIEETGAQAGMKAAEMYKARERDGTHEDIRRALPDAVKAARAEAAKFQDSDSEPERAVAIYWASYAEFFELGLKN